MSILTRLGLKIVRKTMPKPGIDPKYLTSYDPLLTNERVRRVLHIVCTSSNPLSSIQIVRKAYPGNEHRYAHETIKKLCPIITRANYREHFPVSARYLDVSPIPINEREMRTRGTPSEASLEKAYMSSLHARLEYKRTIQRHSERKASQDVVRFDEGRLDAAQKLYATLQRRTYRYSSNLRSLMLYLFNESYLKRQDEKRISDIHRVLSTKRIMEVVAPFLKYWRDFEELGLDVCKLLMIISREFRDQMHLIPDNNYDNPLLLPAIAERYFLGVEEHLDMVQSVPKSDLFATIKHINRKKFDELPEIRNRYRKWILPLIGDTIERKCKVLRGYAREVDIFEFTQQSSQNQKGHGQG